MRAKLRYRITVQLWRGAHAALESVDLDLISTNPVWSDDWIVELVKRIWVVTLYKEGDIWITLRGIHIHSIEEEPNG